MRSELINHLNLSTEAKVLLRTCVEWCKWHKAEEFGVNYKQEEIPMNDIVIDSRLQFGQALQAFRELDKEALLDVSVNNKNNFVLYYKNLLLDLESSIYEIQVQYPLQNFNALKEVEELIKKLPEPTLG